MLEYQGQYGKAKVMIDDIDQATISQIYEFLNHEAFTNPIAIMPDTHAGNGAVIGFTMPMNDKVIPNVVGVDINCGMLSLNVGRNILSAMKKDEIDSNIREYIPFGTNVHRSTEDLPEWFFRTASDVHRLFVMQYNKKFNTEYKLTSFNMKWFENKCEQIKLDTTRAIRSIGTLGGGNHFIELGRSTLTGDYWFTIHSGSRQFGLKICQYWQRKAGKGALAYLTGDDMFGYLSDMVFTQLYAELNRIAMAHHVLSAVGMNITNVEEQIQTNHNFIDFSDFIIRKGAIRSYKNEKMIIPFNMEDGILICMGKSNPEWNFSAPHGAGRVGSRKWAKQNLNVDEARHRMEQNNIYCSALPKDELKGAYKDSKIIEAAIEPTAEIIDRLKPVIAMKDN